MQFGLQELLSYADKNAMAHGVEVRLPFLSHELVQFIFSLPSYFKIKNGFQKNILRQAVNGKLDDAITWRKDKIGYETPQQEWLQNEFFVQKIKTAKQQLVATQILNKNVLTAKTTTEQNWRIIIAAEYL
jgi:asparagine synthase (glutamine-hydrolysing)